MADAALPATRGVTHRKVLTNSSDSCHTIRWCRTGAGFLTAVETHQNSGKGSRHDHHTPAALR
ncbi:MAG TPA: hypothetical protein VGN32_03135, partial [Ktedonobacterales bacterium]|nr:hypothetical protein [Ktedonobacterales bacterium]